MITVRATREGLIGGKTASGYIIDATMPFVALPSMCALRQWVMVERAGLQCRALVLDVGPWNEQDHAYVFQQCTLDVDKLLINPTIRPQAESGKDSRGRVTNGAGIDLGEAVWKALGMTDNGMVDWYFL